MNPDPFPTGADINQSMCWHQKHYRDIQRRLELSQKKKKKRRRRRRRRRRRSHFISWM